MSISIHFADVNVSEGMQAKLVAKRSQVNGTGFSCSQAGSSTVLRSLHRVDAAFCLGPAAPTTGTRILAFGRSAGARHTPNREKTGLH
jgi:hypothetical protein